MWRKKNEEKAPPKTCFKVFFAHFSYICVCVLFFILMFAFGLFIPCAFLAKEIEQKHKILLILNNKKIQILWKHHKDP